MRGDGRSECFVQVSIQRKEVRLLLDVLLDLLLLLLLDPPANMKRRKRRR